MTDYLAEALDLFEYTQRMRRDFHRNPELGFQEVRTAGVAARELRSLGLEVATGIAETGVVAVLEGDRPGPVVLMRFDMDALPIVEESGAEYASQKPGLMHACGHDAHTSIGLTVAKLLLSHRSELAGKVKLVFQPAEEGLGGAQRMVAEGVLENPRPDVVLGLHVWNERPLGWLGISQGPVMAAADVFTVIISGSGGHGAMPQDAIDPLAASAQLITALQTIVSRNVSPLDAAVVSVTMLKAGEAFNIIPPMAVMKGTIRTFQPGVHEMVLRRFQQITAGVAEGMGCKAEIEVETVAPPVINDEAVTTVVRSVAQRVAPDAAIESDFRIMGSEDMAYLMEEIPGCFFFIGSANEEKGLNAPHHHPRFDIDEAVLPRAAGVIAAAAAEFLKG